MSGSAVVLPPPDLPFPVAVPYRVVPDMHRLGSELFGRVERGHFQVDDTLGHYLERKLAQLEEHAAYCRRLHTEHDEAGLADALRQIFAVVAEEHPELVEIEQGRILLKALGLELDPMGAVRRTDPDAPLAVLGKHAARWLEAQRGVLRLADALALAVQEDFVIMRGDEGEHGAELLHVCFPSHWRPAENAGLSYAQIHAPVAHNALLLASARRVMKALLSKGPFVRYTWGLVTDPRLDHNPALPDYPETTLSAEVLTDPAQLGARVFLRVERQTTRALLERRRCLFTIRVSVRPLAEVLTSEARKGTLAAALRSMDDDLLRYKGLIRLRPPLLAWLEA